MENTVKTGIFGNKAKSINLSVSNFNSETSVPEIHTVQSDKYRKLNKIAHKNSVILFGSSFCKSIPVCEIKQAFDLNCNIYNRSFDDLTVADADILYRNVIIELFPSKILIQLGETDLERGFKSVPEILDSYKTLISSIRKNNRKCEIVIVSVCENGSGVQPTEFNRCLEMFADNHGCSFADISSAFTNESPDIRAFSLLRCFMRDKITFCEAMNMV